MGRGERVHPYCDTGGTQLTSDARQLAAAYLAAIERRAHAIIEEVYRRPTGITPGRYSNLTVNEQGLALAGGVGGGSAFLTAVRNVWADTFMPNDGVSRKVRMLANEVDTGAQTTTSSTDWHLTIAATGLHVLDIQVEVWGPDPIPPGGVVILELDVNGIKTVFAQRSSVPIYGYDRTIGAIKSVWFAAGDEVRVFLRQTGSSDALVRASFTKFVMWG